MQQLCSTAVAVLTVSLVLSVTVFVVVAAESSNDGGVDELDSLISSLKMDVVDTDEEVHSRVERQAPPPPKLTAEDLNLADDVSEDYPVVFNIILFLAITLILALIAISVAISTMDPGRDSLIYRVTSAQRFKKDN